MADTTVTSETGMVPGAARLPSVDVLSYSLEMRGGEEGFLGDNANKGHSAPCSTNGARCCAGTAMIRSARNRARRSARRRMQDVEWWGILTLGLGNASFANRDDVP